MSRCRCPVEIKDLLDRYCHSKQERLRMRRALNGLLVRVSWLRRRQEITDNDIDAALAARVPGGSNARDWFLPHEHPKGRENVRDVVKRMLEAAIFISTKEK